MPENKKKTTTMDVRQVKAKLIKDAGRIVQLDQLCAMTKDKELSEKMKLASETAINAIAAVLILTPDIIELPYSMEELKSSSKIMIVESKEEGQDKLAALQRNLTLGQGGNA